MAADFNWFLNKQGPRGQQGVRGEQGFSPVITVAEDTAKAYILRIQTQDDTFLTPNLRGTVDDLGGTYVRYNPETGQVYAGSPDIATTETFGVIRLATQQDVTDLSQGAAVTPELLANQIEALDLPNNYVTTNTAQTINSLKSFRNGISLSSIRNGDGAEVLNFLSGGPFKFKTWNNGLNVEGGTLSVTDGSIKSKSIKQLSTDTNVYDVVTSFDLATTENAGIVKPDGSTVFIDENGVISAKSGAINDNNISTQNVWSSSKTNAEISTVAQEVVDIQGNVASLDADVSTLKPIVESHTTSISSINDSIAMAMSDITELKEGKQDKLTAGNNITIEGNVISATGGGGTPENMVTTDTEQTITGLKTFSAGIKGNGYINSIGLTDLVYTDVNKNPHVGNVSRTLTIHTNPIGNGRILVNDGSSNYEDLHTGNIANFIDGTSITFTNNKLSATGGSGTQIKSADGSVKYGELALGDTLDVANGVLNANLNEIGNEVNTLAGRVTSVESEVANKQDKLSPQAPIIFTGGDSLLPPVDSFTSNYVEGLYQITANQSYHDSDAYQRFKEEIWDGSGITRSGDSTKLTYKRLDGNKFPTGKTIIEVPFVTYRYCLGSINFYTLDENENILETFSQTYDPVGRNTRINYTLTVNPVQDYSGFRFEWVASDASGFDRQSQNRIGRITIRNSNGIGLNIDDNTIKINSDGKLAANLPIGSSTQVGIVQVDGTTIVSNNGVISTVGDSGGSSIDDLNPSTTTVYSSSKVEELLMDYVPLTTYNAKVQELTDLITALTDRVKALETEINGGKA